MMTESAVAELAPEETHAPVGPMGPMPRHRLLLAIALGAVSVLVIGLVVGSRTGQDPQFQGAVLGTPWEKPPIVLSDTSGEPFDLQARTEGRVTLLFFGYLNCPDICPTHLLNIASALEELPNEIGGQVDTVFVTTDPERDDPDSIRAFLDGFDRRFVGLWGTPEQVREAEQQAGIAATVAEPADADGDYVVGHAAQVIAYGPDGVARVVYPFGTRTGDWLNDLPLLVEGVQP